MQSITLFFLFFFFLSSKNSYISLYWDELTSFNKSTNLYEYTHTVNNHTSFPPEYSIEITKTIAICPYRIFSDDSLLVFRKHHKTHMQTPSEREALLPETPCRCGSHVVHRWIDFSQWWCWASLKILKLVWHRSLAWYLSSDHAVALVLRVLVFGWLCLALLR